MGGVVGAKLWNLTGQRRGSPLRHQVLCITHLPQLAAFGDLHLTVRKLTYESAGELRTGTDAQPVAGAARVEELMQMLGAVSDAGRQSVEEMLASVERIQSQGADLTDADRSSSRI